MTDVEDVVRMQIDDYTKSVERPPIEAVFARVVTQGDGGGTCYNLQHFAGDSTQADQSVASCGGADPSTSISNFFGASIVHSGDKGAAGIRIFPVGSPAKSARLTAGYAVLPQLPSGLSTVITYDRNGKAVARHAVETP